MDPTPVITAPAGVPTVPDPRAAIFAHFDPSVPPGGTPPAVPGSVEPPKPTKALTSSGGKLEVNWEQLTQNKFAVAAAVSVATMLALVFTGPSFVKKDNSTDLQSVAIVGALAFIIVVWGPAIARSAKAYLSK